MGDAVLKMTGITKRFAGVLALDNVDLELFPGEVRALIGENGAGKSTLMKILLGIYQTDEGEIEYLGQKVRFKEPKDALDAGISMIHQEISLTPTLDVAENIWMGREDRFMMGGIFINKKARYEATKELLANLGIDIDPRRKVGLLSVAMMQLVELARAVSYDAKIIIMDEPTSALTDEEVKLLYAIVRQLTKKNVTIIFISHKIDEIFAICDSVSVLRDGNMVGTQPLDENVTTDNLIAMIVGRELVNTFEKREVPLGDVVFEARNFSSEYVFRDVNLKIRAGEIVGFSGLMGAGRSEIARAIFGIDKYTGGQLFMDGKEVYIKSPKHAIKEGMGMVTEDRLRMGAIHVFSVKFNATIANIFRYVKFNWVFRKKENADFEKVSKQLSIKYARATNRISTLSGGNQQKVIVARWLLTQPKFLILDEPTRGIDVGAKAEIYRLINDLAEEGMAILFISSEIPEILSMCDRAFVVRNGRLVAEVPRAELSSEILAEHAFGIESNKQA